MPLISGNYNPAAGILLQVAITPPETVTAIAADPSAPQNLQTFMALVDTGASVTCISKKVAAALGLAPSGKTMLSGSTGAGAVDQYTFAVGFIFGATQNPTGSISGSITAHLVQGCEFANHGFGFDVLLGRDIICKGALILTFDGHWSLAF